MEKYGQIATAVRQLEAHLDLEDDDCDRLEEQMCEEIGNAQNNAEIEHDQAVELAGRVIEAVQKCRDRNHHLLGEE